MTALLIVGALVVYVVMYFVYGRMLARRIVRADDSNPTPAVAINDGKDYVPAHKLVLFGHHFASIAGAGPIVGPAIAMGWGWGMGLLWVWLGNVFIGMVHDYLSLMASVRHEGHSIPWIAGKVIKERTGKIFSWFILFALILVVAAFAATVGKLFIKNPSVPSASGFFLISALILGVLLYRVKMNFTLATVIGIVLMGLSIYLGSVLPIEIASKSAYNIWLLIILVYIIFAASLPVNVLLQPRDYLNSWLLFAGLGLGGLGLVFVAGKINFPAFTSFSANVVGGKPSPFIPVVPLIIACGALSGFHSLVASGTSSKQLSRESEGLFIGGGAMLTEGFLATIVILSIGAFGLSVLGKSGVVIENIGKEYVGAIKQVGGPIGIFARSYGVMSEVAFGLPAKLMGTLAALWVTSFALTTLDTTNRLARYTFAEIVEPLRDKFNAVYKFLSNKWTSSLIPALLGIWLAWSGAWEVIWPAFSGANQMLASIALLTVSAWVYKKLKAGKLSLVAIIPALLLWILVTVALVWYVFVVVPSFKEEAEAKAIAVGIIVVVMLILNLFLFYDFIKRMTEKES